MFPPSYPVDGSLTAVTLCLMLPGVRREAWAQTWKDWADFTWRHKSPHRMKNSLAAGNWAVVFFTEHKQQSQNINSDHTRPLCDYVCTKPETRTRCHHKNEYPHPLLTNTNGCLLPMTAPFHPPA